MVSPVDFHVHPPYETFFQHPSAKEALRYFRTKHVPRNIEESFDDFDAAGIGKSVLLPLESETVQYTANVNGGKLIPNEYCAKLVEKYPKRFVSFVCVDPHRGAEGLREMDKFLREEKFVGLKTQAAIQAFYPNDRELMYPFYEKCIAYDVPVLFHCGTTALYYTRIKYTMPIFIDDVALDFPDLRIVCAHFGWPWVDECLALALRHPNVYVELSGWYPRYFPSSLVQYMTRLIPEKFMFGSDYPFLNPTRWLREFSEIEMPTEKRGMILEKNAKKVLKLK